MLNFLRIADSNNNSTNTNMSNRISKKNNSNILRFLISPINIFLSSIILLFLYISFNLIYNYNKNQQYYRMHVIANSNSTDDLIIKLKVSTILEEYISHITEGMLNKDDIQHAVVSSIPTIYDITNSCLDKYNANYSCTIKYGNMYYVEKENMYLDMPSGIYDSIEVSLGKSSGTNFWTTIFPNSSYDKENLKNLKNVFPDIVSIEGISNSDIESTNNQNCISIDDMSSSIPDNFSVNYSFKIVQIIRGLLNK